MVTKGILYFVVGDRKGAYYDMAVRSAEGIKKYMPELKIAFFTDRNVEKKGPIADCFDDVVHTDTPNIRDIWIYKYKCLLSSPYDHTLHLDADTYICEGFPEVFEMLDRFDLVTCLSPHYGLNEKVKGVPICFPEIAGGFMLWRKNGITEAMWHRMIELLPMKSRRRADEPTIRKVMYESDVRYAIIPWEYTCVYLHPGYLFSKVKIMHGRCDSMVADAEVFNQVTGKRVYTGATLLRLKSIRKNYVEVDDVIDYSWRREVKDE